MTSIEAVAKLTLVIVLWPDSAVSFEPNLHSPLSESGRFLSPADAKNKLLDSSARN